MISKKEKGMSSESFMSKLKNKDGGSSSNAKKQLLPPLGGSAHANQHHPRLLPPTHNTPRRGRSPTASGSAIKKPNLVRDVSVDSITCEMRLKNSSKDSPSSSEHEQAQHQAHQQPLQQQQNLNTIDNADLASLEGGGGGGWKQKQQQPDPPTTATSTIDEKDLFRRVRSESFDSITCEMRIHQGPFVAEGIGSIGAAGSDANNTSSMSQDDPNFSMSQDSTAALSAKDGNGILGISPFHQSASKDMPHFGTNESAWTKKGGGAFSSPLSDPRELAPVEHSPGSGILAPGSTTGSAFHVRSSRAPPSDAGSNVSNSSFPIQLGNVQTPLGDKSSPSMQLGSSPFHFGRSHSHSSAGGSSVPNGGGNSPQFSTLHTENQKLREDLAYAVRELTERDGIISDLQRRVLQLEVSTTGGGGSVAAAGSTVGSTTGSDASSFVPPSPQQLNILGPPAQSSSLLQQNQNQLLPYRRANQASEKERRFLC